MTNAIKVLLQMQSGFLQLESTIRKHVHNNQGIIQGVIRISGRNKSITPSSIHNCKDANFFFF
jgi:hypothetical protein